MRILMASHGYPPTVSGVTLVVQKVARAMVAKGHDVTVITGSDRVDRYESEDEGVRLIRVRSLRNPFWKEGPIPFIGRAELDRITAEFKPDILHLHEAALLALQFVRLGRRTGLPLVSTCYYVPRFVSQYIGGEQMGTVVEKIMWRYSVWLFNQCDRVVFATLAHRKQFEEHGMNAPSTIISNGIDTQRYAMTDGQGEDVEYRYHLPPRPRVLFVGRLAKDKAIDVTIRAMRHVVDDLDAHLLLVGRGDHQRHLEKLVSELDLQNHIHFLGFVPEQDLPGLYRAVDLFAIASVCEVQSLPTLQALATGVPVVAANALALPEIVLDGNDGFLISPEDEKGMAEAITRLLVNRELAAKMGQAGLAIAQLHANERTFEKYEALYQEIIQEQPEMSRVYATHR